MLVCGLRLSNVRSRRALEVALGPGLTVLVGPNGAGKTTVLEAIALALGGSLVRPGTVRDLISHSEDWLRVEIDLQEAGECFTAAAAFSRTGERRLSAAGAPLEDWSRWLQAIPLRTFVPDDLRLIKGSPRRRREYLDALATGHDPGYAEELRSYEQALGQRNSLLRNPSLDRAGEDQFAPWERILSRAGLAVTRGRAAALVSFTASFQRMHADLTGEPGNSLRLVYRTNVADLDEEAYRERLARMRGADRQRTYTHLGPHRDDLRLTRRGLDVRDCASQGEQRAALLTLVLAEWERLCDSSRHPLLLLDDVMSELDEERRRALVALIRRGGQTVITTTDLRYFSPGELEAAAVVELSPA